MRSALILYAFINCRAALFFLGDVFFVVAVVDVHTLFQSSMVC